MVCASPRSICAPDDPAAPNARRQNCNRAEAVLALLRIKSSANSRSAGLGLSSRTSSPLTIAPTGLMRSWQTREHNNAASSRASGAGPGDGVADIRCSWRAAREAGSYESRMRAGLIHCGRACGQLATAMTREHEQPIFFLNEWATSHIYPLSLHDALPI